MTNQEAIEMIRKDMKLHHDHLSGQYRKALGMAISALQAQELAADWWDDFSDLNDTILRCEADPELKKIGNWLKELREARYDKRRRSLL